MTHSSHAVYNTIWNLESFLMALSNCPSNNVVRLVWATRAILCPPPSCTDQAQKIITHSVATRRLARWVEVVGAGIGDGGRRDGSSQRVVSDRKSTRLNSSHLVISYAVFCLKKKKK